jgi:hypothetical protein
MKVQGLREKGLSQPHWTLKAMTFYVLRMKYISLSLYDKEYYPGIMNGYFMQDTLVLNLLSETL